MNAESDRPICGKCGRVMRPEDSRIHPEYFLHDACLPDELKPAVPNSGCPTCSHTMDLVMRDVYQIIRHCPRCGTMRSKLLDRIEDTVPKLVTRCRAFAEGLDTPGASGRAVWHRLGIDESINRPENRT